ncbi:hypothetical protein FJT64_000810 [Amphibalanus amphitrite]|uniref:Uncharacterized protein n=1 Tax=Amphibalanus amphitrite TaxID=1232801 RepID=A0A6A4VGX7_AMPAM|nr:hypothetical protein FJT64_000810 [Amphibalanus amphitrite]
MSRFKRKKLETTKKGKGDEKTAEKDSTEAENQPEGIVQRADSPADQPPPAERPNAEEEATKKKRKRKAMDGMLLLRPYQSSIVAWSMLVSPELTFLADASIQLDYWLWFNISQPHTPVSFMLFRPPSVRVLRPYIVGGSEDPTLAPLKVLHIHKRI